jgi:Putative viral replication protein.
MPTTKKPKTIRRKAKPKNADEENQAVEPFNMTDEVVDAKITASRYKHYLFTFNNYDKIDYQKLVIDEIREMAEWAVINYEIAPTTGTPHLQGVFRCKLPYRLTQIYNLFPIGLWARNVISVPKAINYCCKEESRDPTKKPIIIGIIPDPQTIQKNGVLKPQKAVDDTPAIPEEPIKTIEKLHKWQQAIVDMVIDKETPDREPVYWFYSGKGKIGKTSLLRYLWKHHPSSTIYVRETEDNNMFNHLFEAYKNNNYIANQRY